jgi:CheY-like chemotaxis protein
MSAEQKLRRSAVMASEEPSAEVPIALEKVERARVLVVDDDERNLLAIRTVLEDVADIVEASSGEEALRQLLKGEFAVILLDVYMPGLDGYETAQIIRSREQTKRIPIIFLSAVNKETQHLIRGYSMGAVDYVFKPFEPIAVRSKVAVFVDLYTMRGRSSARRAPSSSCWTPISAPMPSGSAPSRSFASRSSARRRSSNRCRSCSISSRSTSIRACPPISAAISAG